MTKSQAQAFLTDAGHITEIGEVDEDHSYILFKYRGKWIRLYTYEQDPEFLNLQCSYRLDPGYRDELEVARTIARLQNSYKVVKLAANAEPQSVTAAAEQFLPASEGFERIFWRSVDLVIHAAREVCHELDALVAIEEDAAERFTERMEVELKLKQENT